MKPFPPLVYFGSDSFSAAMLERLLAHEDFKSSLKYVVTKTPRTMGRGQKTEQTAVERVAKDRSEATVVYANTQRELDDALSDLNFEHDQPMGVLVSYGVLVSDFVLNLFPHGIINFHPSRLPAYRGPSPVETALLSGDTELGLSVMRLVSAMDAGPVYDRTTLAIRGDETKNELYERIVAEGGELFYSTLVKIADGSLKATEQDESNATYTRLIKKQDGELRPDKKTADELAREIRTFLGFPKSRYALFEHPVIITKAHVVSSPHDASVTIACAEHTFLAVDELVAPSGRTMSGEAFLRGYAA